MFYKRFAKKIICLFIVGVLVLNPVAVRASGAGTLIVSGGTIMGAGSRTAAIAVLMSLATSLGFTFHLSQAAKDAGETVSDWLDDQLSEWEALEQQKIDIIKQLSSGSSGGGGDGDNSGSDDSGGDKNKIGKNGKFFIAAGALAIAQKFFNWLKSRGNLTTGSTGGGSGNYGVDLTASSITGLVTSDGTNVSIQVKDSLGALKDASFVVSKGQSSTKYYLCVYASEPGLTLYIFRQDGSVYDSYNINSTNYGFLNTVLNTEFQNYPQGSRVLISSGDSASRARNQFNYYLSVLQASPTVSGSFVEGSEVVGFYDSNSILHKLVANNTCSFYSVYDGSSYYACAESETSGTTVRWYSFQNNQWMPGGAFDIDNFCNGKYFTRVSSSMNNIPEGLFLLTVSSGSYLGGAAAYPLFLNTSSGSGSAEDRSYLEGDYNSSDLDNPDGKYTEVDPQILPDMAEQVNGDTTIDIEEYLKAIIESINKKSDPSYIPEQVLGTDPNTLESVPLEVPGADTFPSQFPEDQDTAVEPPEDAETVNLPDKVPDPEQALPLITFDLKEYFPFCLPFDAYDIVAKFVADPVAPAFDIPFNEPFSGTHTVIHVDLSPFDSMMEDIRNAELIAFVVGLALVTRSMFAK